MGSPKTDLAKLLLGDRTLTGEEWVEFLDTVHGELYPLLQAFTFGTVASVAGVKNDPAFPELKLQGYFTYEVLEKTEPLATGKRVWGLLRSGDWLVVELIINQHHEVERVGWSGVFNTAEIGQIQGHWSLWRLMVRMVEDARRSFDHRQKVLLEAEGLVNQVGWVAGTYFSHELREATT